VVGAEREVVLDPVFAEVEGQSGERFGASLDRTQEVGGSNPPSSIASNVLQMRTIALGAPVLTNPPVQATFGQ
jgi:hypothetical protein